MTYKLGFIGTGVMAGAILDRTIINATKIGILPEEILIYDLDVGKMSYFAELGVSMAMSEDEVFASSDIVLLGVKPQFFTTVMSKVSNIKAKTVISIMAGKQIKELRKFFPEDVGVVRVMPNTPCKIGKGVMALCFDKVVPKAKSFVTAIFNSCGNTLEITEDKFDAVTGISGSGPAYLYMFANALIKAGIDAGLSVKESEVLTFGMLEGSTLYAKDAGIDLGTMVDMVCSKGGTTIEAVKYFREHELDDIVLGAVRACVKRSMELSEGK